MVVRQGAYLEPVFLHGVVVMATAAVLSSTHTAQIYPIQRGKELY